MSTISVTKSNFEHEILESDKPVLLDFWATWCMPCKMISPIVDEIASELPDVKVGKINIYDEPELASAFNVMSIPTLVVMKNGKIMKTMAGVRPKASILKMLA